METTEPYVTGTAVLGLLKIWIILNGELTHLMC